MSCPRRCIKSHATLLLLPDCAGRNCTLTVVVVHVTKETSTTFVTSWRSALRMHLHLRISALTSSEMKSTEKDMFLSSRYQVAIAIAYGFAKKRTIKGCCRTSGVELFLKEGGVPVIKSWAILPLLLHLFICELTDMYL